jgi:hypothetical protein
MTNEQWMELAKRLGQLRPKDDYLSKYTWKCSDERNVPNSRATAQ